MCVGKARRAVRRARFTVEARHFGQHFSAVARFAFTMMKDIALSRPATSAIAVFLALSTPVAFAQEAPTITMTPPVAAPDTVPATPESGPATPESGPATLSPPAVQPAPPTTPQPVIRVPLDIAPPEAAPAGSEPAEPARAEPTARAGRGAQQASTPSTAAPAVAPPAEAAPSARMEGAAGAPPPAALPTAAPAEAVAAEAPPPAPAAFPWELVGGAAALIALGAGGLALARRRRVEPGADRNAMPPASATTPGQTPGQSGPIPAHIPTPARSIPVFAAAPRGRMGRHEAMAMLGPTPDNPFLTLSKRLKRARFHDRQERLAYDQTLGTQKDMTRPPASAWDIARRETPGAAQQQEVRRPEPARGQRGLRPAWSRS